MDNKIEHCFGLTENSEIVESLKTSIIKKIVKAYNHISLVDCIRETPHIRCDLIFNALPGTVLIYLENNDVIGFARDKNKNSIVTWFDVRQGVKYETQYYIPVFCDFMTHNDDHYSYGHNWGQVIGNKITKISVMIYDEGKTHSSNDYFQKAIILETEIGNLVLTMLPGFERFQLIRKTQIPHSIRNSSTIIEL